MYIYSSLIEINQYNINILCKHLSFIAYWGKEVVSKGHVIWSEETNVKVHNIVSIMETTLKE